ncbi:MAG TPA: YciI family protein [Myxococcota bacterium]|nr:YciI family protein [Myxococcota bacterium]
MRFVLLLKATPNSEAGVEPPNELMQEMMEFNEKLVNAGVLVSGDGLQPSSKGARVRITAGSRTVTDGPFTETKELIAGFWILDVKSRQEAIDWALRSPHPHPGEDAEIEVRQLFEVEDFSDVTPELVAKEKELRARSKR